MTDTLEVVQAAISADDNGIETLDKAIIEAIDQARTTCNQNGNTSNECVIAWNLVEELQMEKAHQQQAKIRKTELEIYCEQYPEADECRIYDT